MPVQMSAEQAYHRGNGIAAAFDAQAQPPQDDNTGYGIADGPLPQEGGQWDPNAIYLQELPNQSMSHKPAQAGPQVGEDIHYGNAGESAPDAEGSDVDDDVWSKSESKVQSWLDGQTEQQGLPPDPQTQSVQPNMGYIQQQPQAGHYGPWVPNIDPNQSLIGG